MTTKEKIKNWIVRTASVTKPNNSNWSVSVTLNCYDYNEYGETIEKAYRKLTEKIYNSKYLKDCFIKQVIKSKS